MYDYLIFDADHTLIDFYADERAAFRRTFEYYAVPYTEETIEAARRLSDLVWAEAGLNDVHLPRVQENFHRTYFAHLPGLMERISREVAPMSAPSEEIADFFVRQLYVPAVPLGDALGVVKRLSARYPICVATNGIEGMQRARLREFLPFLQHLFVSERLGCIKPGVAFFSAMLQELHAEAGQCLFVGDSLSSDVAGCAAVGMDCAWLNPDANPLPEGVFVAFQISSLNELESIL